MSHAEKCPICGGTGKVYPSYQSTGTIEITCHGCGGYGWVEVRD